jgi:hypothetical protein
MHRLNQDILSEINNLLNTSDEMKDFIKWVVEFERENSEKVQFSYKTEIENKLDELFPTKKDA